jgi:hypothetical protein
MSGRTVRVLLLTTGAALALAGCETLRRAKPPPPAPPPAVAPAPPPVVLVMPSKPPPAPAPPPKSCVPRNLPPPPRYPDSDGALRAAPGAADRYQLMAAGRILREQRLDDLEKVIAGCR